jgi:hypothetical protein
MQEMPQEIRDILDANKIDLINRLDSCKQTPFVNPETLPFTLTRLSYRPDQEIIVVRDDFLCGGSKSRFCYSFLKEKVKQGYREFVYISPWYGLAGTSLAWDLKLITQETGIFLRSRVYIDKYPLDDIMGELPPYIKIATEYGADVIQVPHDQEKFDIAHDYCRRTGALFIEPGFNHPEVIQKISELVQPIKQQYGTFDEIWTAIGSGTLIRGLQKGNLGKEYYGVCVFQNCPFIDKAHGIIHNQGFNTPVKLENAPPFRSAMYYDGKVFQHVRNRPGKILLWNVA